MRLTHFTAPFASLLVVARSHADESINSNRLGSFAETAAYSAFPVLLAFVVLGSIWVFQYLRRRKSHHEKTLLLVHKVPMFWALLTVLAGTVAGLLVANNARNMTYTSAQTRFMQQVQRSEDNIREAVTGMVKPLNGVRGTFVSSEFVSRSEFTEAIAALELTKNYPGIRGFGYIERVSPEKLKAFVAVQPPVAGQPFTVKQFQRSPGDKRTDHLIIKYVEPLYPNRSALGFDIATEAQRREAAYAAMDSGEATMTRQTPVLTDVLQRQGFLLFVPVYRTGRPPATREERQRELTGWAFAPAVWAEMLSDASDFTARQAEFQIFDGPDLERGELIYDSAFPTGETRGIGSQRVARASLFTVVRPVMLLDQVFYIRVTSGLDFESAIDRRGHLNLALWGSTLSVLAALIIWLLMAGRTRAENLARSMTADLDRLAIVAKRTSNAVVITDTQQRITWVNEGFTRITGYSLEEALGKVPGHLLQSENTDRSVTAAIGADLRNLRESKHQILNRHKDGHHYWLDLEIQPLFGRDGTVTGFMAMESDVTAEVEARLALAREKEHTENILEGTGVGTWESNLITGESVWSDRWGSMMGYERADVVPNADVFWRQILHPEDLPRILNAQSLCASGEMDGHSCEVRVKRKDGRWMWILSRAKVMSRLPDGRLEWIGGIHTDITEFKETELNLRDVEAFLDRAGRIAGVGAWQVNLRTQEIVWSDQTCLIHGVPAGHQPTMEEALSYYPPEARENLRAEMDRALENGESWDLTSEFINKRGEKRWVRSYGEVEYGDAGPVRLLGAFQDVTQDLESQVEVQRSSALLRGAIDAINEAFVLYDPEDRLVFCNDKYRALYAKSAEFMQVGATFESIIRGGVARGQYRDALGQEESWIQERLAAHRDGNMTLEQRLDDGRWLKVVERRMPDGHIVGFRVDVTSLKEATARAESVSQSLAAQQRRLQSILEGTNVGTWEWSVGTGEVTFNARWAEIIGYTLEELAPIDINTWIRLSHPQDLLISNDRLMEHFERRSEFYECEARMRHKDGRWIWVLDRGRVASWTSDGKPQMMSGTHMDITERKMAEQALAETSATLQNVLDSAVNVGIVSVGLDRVIRVFNRGAENLLGYSADEVVDKMTTSNFFDLTELAVLKESLALQLGRDPSVQEVFDHVASTREQQEWSLVRKDGERFKANLIVSPMRGADGQIWGHLAVMYDISRQKEYESSLRNAMLMAEQSSVAKSQFLANMSHEIRTPMNAILGMLQLLNTTALDSRQDDYVDKAKGAARSLLGLLNDILDFSKVEAGKMQLAPEPFHLESLLADLSVILGSNLSDKDVDLVYEIDPAIPAELIGDALRIKQVLINLGGNAVKFTEQGEVVIRWALLARTSDRIKLQISVSDTGIGIAQENQARIFEAFTQAEANTTRRFGGTGLGLVISTRLIRLMGGELELQSTLGKGSTFSFNLELPVLKLDAAPAPSAGDRAPVRRVLLVDDNPVALASCVALAKSLAWDVTQATSGEQALALVRSALEAGGPSWDAIFVDARMPGLDGWDTVRGIRQIYGDMLPPRLILFSPQSREAIAKRPNADPKLIDGMVVKPLTAGSLAQSLVLAYDAPSAAAQTSLAGAGSRLAGMRILLVEDNAINQQVAKELLGAEGARVSLADNGLLGVNAIKAAVPQFDAVLMDLQMPVMDGLTAVRLLRRDARLRDLPVIAMTANAMSSDREACLAAGMNDHVGKPFDLNKLVEALVRHTHWSPRSLAGPAPATIATQPSLDADGEVWPQGLEIAEALQRMGGNRALLRRAILAFVKDARLLGPRVADLLAHHSHADAKRELHALKGLAATLGATQLSQLAAQAEKSVDPDAATAPVDALIAEIVALLETVLPALEEVASRLTEAHDAAAALTAEAQADEDASAAGNAREQLAGLLLALRASDMTAMELHAEVRQSAGESLAASMEPLDAAMADLEFERTAVECEKLLAQIS